MNIPQVTCLPSGLRVVTVAMPAVESVSVGLWVGVGSRHESARLNGMTHFIEHMLFKGTRRRSARQITQAVEGVGGYLNAFTGEENTCFYAKASHRHLGTLLDVLTDMYRRPRLDRLDVEKERAVIKEELLMYRDQPQQHVQELLLESLWPRHPLGRAVAGTLRSLDRFDQPAVRRYLQSRYRAGNTILAVAGHCHHAAVVAQARRLLALPARGGVLPFVPAPSRQRRPQLVVLEKEVEQTHLAIGIRALSRHDPRRYALRLLSVMLGESMSSRLFQVVREQHGLAYAIQSATAYFTDTGAFFVSAGLETKKLRKALRLIIRELQRAAAKPPTAAELRRTKDYSIGQMWMGLESSSNQMMWAGEHLLAYGRIEDPRQIEQRVQAITTEEVHRVARDLFQDHRLNTAVITNGHRPEDLAPLLRL